MIINFKKISYNQYHKVDFHLHLFKNLKKHQYAFFSNTIVSHQVRDHNFFCFLWQELHLTFQKIKPTYVTFFWGFSNGTVEISQTRESTENTMGQQISTQASCFTQGKEQMCFFLSGRKRVVCVVTRQISCFFWVGGGGFSLGGGAYVFFKGPSNICFARNLALMKPKKPTIST